jgi:hypothetical protein
MAVNDSSQYALALQAEAGDASAQYRLGVLFLLGSVINQDTEAACRWLLAAAAGNRRDAQALVERLAPFYGNAIEPGNKPKQLPDWRDWLAQPHTWQTPRSTAVEKPQRFRCAFFDAASQHRWRRRTTMPQHRAAHNRISLPRIGLIDRVGVTRQFSAPLPEWPLFRIFRSRLAAYTLAGVAWACLAFFTIGVGLLVLWTPAATLMALAAGATTRWLGHRLRLKALQDSSRGRALAQFALLAGAVEASFDDRQVTAYVQSRRWRAAAAFVAGVTCFGVQHLRHFDWSPIAVAINIQWLNKTAVFCSPALPLLIGIFFLAANGPQAYWINQVKAAVRARAAAAIADLAQPREIDGLEAGVAALYRQLDLWWSGDYRSAVNKWIESHMAQAVFEPRAALALLAAVTELARIDLNHLIDATESYRSLESQRCAVEALARASHQPHLEARWEESVAEMDELRTLAFARSWELLADRAVQLAAEFEELIQDISLRSGSMVTLAPGSDPYRLLGIDASASTASLKKLRLRLAQVYHPDIGGETGNDAKMAELNAAYDEVMRQRKTQDL